VSTPSSFEELLDRLEELVSRVDELDDAVREDMFELLDGVDLLHRSALTHLGEALGPTAIEQLRSAHPAITWLFEAYAVGVDEVALAEVAIDQVRPFIHSHGGEVEVLDVRGGVVSLHMTGACAGCTSSADTLRDGIEEALREHFPGFAGIEVTEDDAEPHPPPGPTLVQIISRPA
jgi:Fe-S cluster biogenesis protein NfuA